MIEVLDVLRLPLLGAELLSLVGERTYAPSVNVDASVLTFVVSDVRTVRVVTHAPMT